jgi:hypothetical protein
MLRQISQIRDLLRRQADLTQLVVGEPKDCFRRDAARLDAFRQSQSDGTRGLRGNLLRQDGPHQQVESVSVRFQRKRPDPTDQTPEDRIDAGKMFDGGVNVVLAEGHGL